MAGVEGEIPTGRVFGAIMLVRGVEGGREGKEEGVESLSLTVRLLYKVADRFIVQWQGLRVEGEIPTGRVSRTIMLKGFEGREGGREEGWKMCRRACE